MNPRSLLSLCALTSAWFVTAPAAAHVSLNAPKSRFWQSSTMMADQNKQKTGPCGATSSRTTDASLITTFKPGEKVTVKWAETVQHVGHFEISFDSDGQDFPTPGTAPSATSGVTVLVPNIADKSSSDYTAEITLPNIECSKCTLQLVQVMTTASPPYGKNDLYFNCADIILKSDGAGGSGGASGGGAGGASAGGGGAPGGGGGAANAGGGGLAGGASGAGMMGAGGAIVNAGGSGNSAGNFAGGASGSAGMPTTTNGGSSGFAGSGSGGQAGATTGPGGQAGSGSSAGGTTSNGGSASLGGAIGTSSGGSTSASGGAPGASGSGTQPPPDEPGCSVAGPSRPSSWPWLLALSAGLAVGLRRRRR